VGDTPKGIPSRVRTRVTDLFQANDVGDALKGSPSRGRALAKDMVLVVLVLAIAMGLALAASLTSHPTPSSVSFDFSISVNPSSASIAPGTYTSTNITATLALGSPREVQFSCSSLPTGAACAFTPRSCTLACNASLILFTSPSTPVGTYALGIGASVGTLSRTVPFTLNLTNTPPPPSFDFTVAARPNNGTVAPGGTASTNVTATLTSGATREIQFSCANLSSGITCMFSPPRGKPTISTALSVRTTNHTSEGTYRINITAANGSLSRTIPYTLRVVNVTSSNTTTVTFQKGDGGSYSRTDDAFIYNETPDRNYGYNLSLLVDAGNCIANGTICRSLIAFPNFLGPNLGQVPVNSTIVSATLQLNVLNPSLVGGPQLLYQVTEPWTEGNVTWNAFATPGMPGSKGPAMSFNASTLGLIRVNITHIVQNWTNGDPNHGVFIWSQSWDGADYNASESSKPPKLNVTFRSPRAALGLAAEPVFDSARPLGSRVPASPSHLGPALSHSSKIRVPNVPAKGAESGSNARGTRFDDFGESVFFRTLGRLEFDPLIFVIPSLDLTSTCKIADGQKA